MCTGDHPFIPAADVAEVRMQFSTPGGVAENVFHFVNDAAGWEPASLEALADKCKDVWKDEVQPLVAGTVALERILVKDLTTADGTAIEYTTDLPQAGTHTSPGLPSNVTLSIKKSGLLTGRSRRGRFYFIGAVEGGVTGDNFNSAYADDIVDAYSNLLAFSLGGDAYNMVVVSYCSGGEWRLTALVTEVINLSTDGIVDSQRRRLSGRGI